MQYMEDYHSNPRPQPPRYVYTEDYNFVPAMLAQPIELVRFPLLPLVT